jgi:hypothetical protein
VSDETDFIVCVSCEVYDHCGALGFKAEKG